MANTTRQWTPMETLSLFPVLAITDSLLQVREVDTAIAVSVAIVLQLTDAMIKMKLDDSIEVLEQGGMILTARC